MKQETDITARGLFYLIKGILLLMIPYTLFFIKYIYSESQFEITNSDDLLDLVLISSPVFVIVGFNFLRFRGLELMSLTENGIQLKSELVKWQSIHRIYLKGQGKLVVEFYRDSELYIAKTLVSMENLKSSERVLRKVREAWGKGKDRLESKQD